MSSEMVMDQSNLMDVMITQKAFEESQEKNQSSLKQILCNLHFQTPCRMSQIYLEWSRMFKVNNWD